MVLNIPQSFPATSLRFPPETIHWSSFCRSHREHSTSQISHSVSTDTGGTN